MQKELADKGILIVYQYNIECPPLRYIRKFVKITKPLLLLPLFLLSGCARYVRWGRSQFEQITHRPVHERDFDPYIQSIDRYDGFNTVGHFDIVWYARPVMNWFFCQYAGRVGDHSEAWKALHDQHLREQHERIVFYISLPLSANSLVAQLSQRNVKHN